MTNRVILFEGKEIRITASFGVTGFDASTPAEQISTEGLIRLATIASTGPRRRGVTVLSPAVYSPA